MTSITTTGTTTGLTCKYLTSAEVAEQLGVSPDFVWKLCNSHRIRYVKVGRYIRIPEDAVQEFLEANTREVR